MSAFAASCAESAGTASTPTMMLRSRQTASIESSGLTWTRPTIRPTLAASLSKMAAMLIPCSAKIGELAIASPEPAGADEGDVVLALRAQDLADLVQQRVDRVADAALAELAETREITPDLRGVDVRVLGDLLRGDPVLAHLPRLGQHLQVAAQPRCHSDCQPLRQLLSSLAEVTNAGDCAYLHSARRRRNRQETRARSSAASTTNVNAGSPSISITGSSTR